MAESLKEKTAKGLFWGGMNNGVQQLLGLAFGIILGRLLDPSDYGMTAMLAVFSVCYHCFSEGYQPERQVKQNHRILALCGGS